MTPEIAVGLIGFGLGGRVFHAPTIAATAGLRLAAILQRSGDEAAKAYPEARVVRSIEELLSQPDIQGVVISTPNDTHVELGRACLFAGRHVVMDKPLAPTFGEARELAQLARKQDRLLTVYQNRRFDGDFLTLRKLLADGRLGRVVTFESHFDRYRPVRRPATWRERAGPGSGLWCDLGPHLLDQALVLCGNPKAIWADIRTERQGGVTDDAFDVMVYFQGVRALLRASVFASSPTTRFLVQGERGSYLKYGLDPQEAALAGGERPGTPHWGEDPPERWGTLSVAEGDGVTSRKIETLAGNYVGYYENVRDAILAVTPPEVTVPQALNLMYLLELARESSRQRKTLDVELPRD
jgi:predicted dehydrogenase